MTEIFYHPFVFILALFLIEAVCRASMPIYLDPTRSVEERVQDLIDNMTLEEKVGQLVQISTGENWQKDFVNLHIGTVLTFLDAEAEEVINLTSRTRLKVPVLNGVDAIHGHGN
jgi:beta-glucosidase